MPKPLWRKIIDFPLVAMVIALALTLGTLKGVSWLRDHLPEIGNEDLAGATWVVIAIGALLVIYKLVVRRLGEEPQDDLPFAEVGRGLAGGTVGAFVLMTVIVGAAAAFGIYRIVGWGGSSDLVRILFGAGLSAAFFEELLFRGILFRWLEQFGGSWFALAFTSGLFGYAHINNPNATWFASLAIALEAGVLLGGVYMVTRSLWAPIGLHFGWNVTQGYIWDVPVSGNDVDGLVEAQLRGNELLSGGAFGLEASLIAMIIATLAGIYLVWLAAQRGEVVRPWWVRRRMARANL